MRREMQNGLYHSLWVGRLVLDPAGPKGGDNPGRLLTVVRSRTGVVLDDVTVWKIAHNRR